MAIGVNFRGTASVLDMSTSDISLTPSSNFAANSLAVLVIIRNANANQNDFSIDSVTDSNQNKWENAYQTYQTNPWYFVNIYVCNNANTLTTSDTVDVNFTSLSGSLEANCHLLEITVPSSQIKAHTFDYRISHISSSVGSIVVPKSGDIVVCGNFNQSSASITGDSDTTDGSWSSNDSITTNSLYSIIQYKVTTGTSNQDYTATSSSVSGSFSFLIMEVNKTINPLGIMGFFGI